MKLSYVPETDSLYIDVGFCCTATTQKLRLRTNGRSPRQQQPQVRQRVADASSSASHPRRTA